MSKNTTRRDFKTTTTESFHQALLTTTHDQLEGHPTQRVVVEECSGKMVRKFPLLFFRKSSRGQTKGTSNLEICTPKLRELFPKLDIGNSSRAGKLKDFHQNWRVLTSDTAVLEIIQGLKLPIRGRGMVIK